MKLVVDASVAVKWFLNEDHADRARQVNGTRYELMAPERFWPEVGHALRKHHRRGMLDDSEIRDLISAFMAFDVAAYPVKSRLPAAVHLAMAMNHSVHDCVYLALALDEDCQVVTADGRFADAIERTGFGEHVLRLENVA